MTGTPFIEGVRDLAEIGRGGFGVVYRGTEVEFGRDVAVKVLMRLQDDRAKRRFARERRAMGAVSDHENIVTVYRGGVTPTEEPYLVMEYVRGGSLSDRLSTVGPLGWREAAEIGAKLADALTVAHRAGILHRDVKPGNVFLTEHGEPKLGDFGIAVLDDGQASRTAGVTASVAHAPPEIVDGQRGDERSDLYSLASTVYALVNGAGPFSRSTDEGLSALLSRLATEPPRPLHLESAASQFEAVVLKGLSKRPEDRYPTVAEFGNELRRAARVTADIPRPNVPLAIAPTNPAVPPGAAPRRPQALAADHPGAVPVSVPAPAPAPRRQVSAGQLGFLALLLLAIAGFGGWAVARAAFGDTTEQTTDVGPTSTQPPGTIAVEPTVAPTPAPAPTPQATRAPRPTPEPTAAPVPETEVAGERGSSFLPNGFIRVEDNSGAITVDVPSAWTQERFDITDPDTGRASVSGRAIAIGGTVAESGQGIDLLALDSPGVYIFAERAPRQPELDVLLDVNLAAYSECDQGERAEITLADGRALYQILECQRRDGAGSSGVIVLAMVTRNDPTVGVTIALQLSDLGDVDMLGILVPTIRIDSDHIPDIGALDS